MPPKLRSDLPAARCTSSVPQPKYCYCNDGVCRRRPERKRLIKKVPETNQYTNPLINCPKIHRFPICPNSLPPSLPSPTARRAFLSNSDAISSAPEIQAKLYVKNTCVHLKLSRRLQFQVFIPSQVSFPVSASCLANQCCFQ